MEIWNENREIFKAILTDVLLFLLALSALFAGHLLLHLMEEAGYAHERIVLIEGIHYWAYLAVDVLFALDLVGKLSVFLFLRRKPGANQ